MKSTIGLRRFAGIFLIILLIAIALSVYFLRFIPQQRNIFHRSAFLELSQIERALSERNEAYRHALLNYIQQPGIKKQADIFKNTPLDTFFHHDIYPPNDSTKPYNDFKNIGASTFHQDEMTKIWEISYPLISTNGATGLVFSKNLDTLLSQIVNTYKDIFENFLLIRDKQASLSDSITKSIDPDSIHRPPPGEVIFNPGRMAIDYEINTDSLLKKVDGLSLLNVRDVNIEGNPYKLFLFPFKLGEERIVLAGVISLDRYKEAFQKIPFSLISLSGVLILLLLIHLPIIRIYMLGAYERIRDMDIRLLIGSYFIAAFVGFFLFTKIFLDQEQADENKGHLSALSNKVSHSFVGEISSMIRQLKIFDSTFDSLARNHSPLLNAMCSNALQNKNFGEYRNKLDTVFKPHLYPFGDNLFWIDSSGNWIARWGFKKVYDNSPLIKVADRDYYNQFKDSESLILPDPKGPPVSFTILPTLSKLDGEYVISVVIPSQSQTMPDLVNNGEARKINSPWLLGMSSQMHSVYRVVLPTGYYFSIVNEEGNILYDSKPGKALLSNITKETDEPFEILQTARYHNERYFDHFILRGKEIALLTTPIKGFPYELLVYHTLSNNDTFQEHLIGLSGFITGCVIILLICTAVINEWSRKKSYIFQSSALHFDWLYPASLKEQYYKHLIGWMVLLFLIYVLTWIIIECCIPGSEFLLLFVSILFPFFIAMHYYLLREKYFNFVMHKKPRPHFITYILSNLQLLLILIILLVNFFAFAQGFTWGKFYPLFCIQIVFLAAIWTSISSFKNPQTNNKNSAPTIGYQKLLCLYSLAIITGILLISIIPASSIFWLIFRQECSLESNSELLGMAKGIQERRTEINRRLGDYKFDKKSQSDLLQLRKLKYDYGIYSLLDSPIRTDGISSDTEFARISGGYTGLHRLFFPQDSVILAWSLPPNLASDASWHFNEADSDKFGSSQLMYNNLQDGINKDSIRMTGDSNSSWGASRLMMEKFKDNGPLNMIIYFGSLFLSILLAFRLTLSLAKRIFLVELHESKNWTSIRNKPVDITLRDSIPQRIKDIEADQDFRNQARIRYFHCMQNINSYENNPSNILSGERILSTSKLLAPIYDKIWEKLSARERFILFDFSIDGFANYKTEKIIHELLEKGILFFNDKRLSIAAPSFREYILDHGDDQGVNTYMKKAEVEDSWKHFRVPLLLVLGAVGMFIFITQDAIYQKLTGLFASVGSLLPLLSILFNKSPDSQTDKQGQ